jgi:hypothetical protein
MTLSMVMGLRNDSILPGQGGETYSIANSIGQSGPYQPSLKHLFRDCILSEVMLVDLGLRRVKPLIPGLVFSNYYLEKFSLLVR